jgi:hypothetical protein
MHGQNPRGAMAGCNGINESDSTAECIGFIMCPRGGIGRRARFRFALLAIFHAFFSSLSIASKTLILLVEIQF